MNLRKFYAASPTFGWFYGTRNKGRGSKYCKLTISQPRLGMTTVLELFLWPVSQPVADQVCLCSTTPQLKNFSSRQRNLMWLMEKKFYGGQRPLFRSLSKSFLKLAKECRFGRENDRLGLLRNFFRLTLLGIFGFYAALKICSIFSIKSVLGKGALRLVLPYQRLSITILFTMTATGFLILRDVVLLYRKRSQSKASARFGRQ